MGAILAPVRHGPFGLMTTFARVTAERASELPLGRGGRGRIEIVGLDQSENALREIAVRVKQAIGAPLLWHEGSRVARWRAVESYDWRVTIEGPSERVFAQSLLDLPVAVAIMSKHLGFELPPLTLVAGTLSAKRPGQFDSARGLLAVLRTFRDEATTSSRERPKAIVPQIMANTASAALIDGKFPVYVPDSFVNLIDALDGGRLSYLFNVGPGYFRDWTPEAETPPDRRALAQRIVRDRLNILVSTQPPRIHPADYIWARWIRSEYRLEESQAIEVAEIYDAVGIRHDSKDITRQPPFRAPHYTVSPAGFFGGGVEGTFQAMHAGEFQLARYGVLALQNLDQFAAEILLKLGQKYKNRTSADPIIVASISPVDPPLEEKDVARWRRSSNQMIRDSGIFDIEITAGGEVVDLRKAATKPKRLRKKKAEEGAILYHGTRHASIEQLRPSTGGEFGPGIYLSANPDTARFYATSVARGPDPPTILEVEADIRNPVRIEKTEWIRKTAHRTPSAVRRALERKGHDAIVGVGLAGDEQIVVFDPAAVRIVGCASALARSDR